jgi:hypothetical protein
VVIDTAQLQLRVLRLCELSESNGLLVKVKHGVDILHERVAKEEDIGAQPQILRGNRRNAVLGAGCGLSEVEVGCGDGPVLPAPVERDGGWRCAGV